MNLQKWNTLDEAEQAEAVWEGSFLATRFEGEFKVCLYQLTPRFFVELFYNTRLNVLRKIVPLEAGDIKTALIGYLEEK